MQQDQKAGAFLLQYGELLYNNAQKLRELIFENLPGIIEQFDLSARMIAYCYGQKYTEMICTIIPSKKGIKLGFYKGVDLPDPDGILTGTGKISRYIEIQPGQQINIPAIKQLLVKGLAAYKERTRK